MIPTFDTFVSDVLNGTCSSAVELEKKWNWKRLKKTNIFMNLCSLFYLFFNTNKNKIVEILLIINIEILN